MHNHSFSGPCCGPRFPVARIIAMTIGGVFFAALFALLFGWLVQLLWNWLMPMLFHLTTITYWQAFGIVILAKILFGCHGAHYGGRHSRRFHRHHFHKQWDRDCDGDEDDESWKPHGSYKNWKYYDQYWRDEGKTAFEAYIDKMDKEGKA